MDKKYTFKTKQNQKKGPLLVLREIQIKRH